MARSLPARRDTPLARRDTPLVPWGTLLAQRDALLAQRDTVFGVDFSGARDAERRIWIAQGLPTGSGLHIEACGPLSQWRPAARGPESSAQALAEFIGQYPRAVFALDFPFGLPQALLGPRATWRGFVGGFRKSYPGPQVFRELCRGAGPPGEPRRATDALARTPFCPYNLRIYRQTWYGIAHVLAPLLAQGRACVPPMQPLQAGRPWLLEICPASTLKAMGLYRRFPKYKQAGPRARRCRGKILAAICAAGPLTIARGLKQAILADAGGDALDSVIAAFTAFKLLHAPRLSRVPSAHTAAALREAWVYCWPEVHVKSR